MISVSVLLASPKKNKQTNEVFFPIPLSVKNTDASSYWIIVRQDSDLHNSFENIWLSRVNKKPVIQYELNFVNQLVPSGV